MERLARAALDLDPYDGLGLGGLRRGGRQSRAPREAAADAARAVELNPSSADIP